MIKTISLIGVLFWILGFMWLFAYISAPERYYEARLSALLDCEMRHPSELCAEVVNGD